MRSARAFKVPLPEGIDVGFLFSKNDQGRLRLHELGNSLGCFLRVVKEENCLEVTNPKPKWFKGREAIVSALEMVPFFLSVSDGSPIQPIVASLEAIGERHGCSLTYNKSKRSIRVVPLHKESYSGRTAVMEELGGVISNSASLGIKRDVDFFIDKRVPLNGSVKFESNLCNLDGFVRPQMVLDATSGHDVCYPSNLLRELLGSGAVCPLESRSKLQFRVGTLLLSETHAMGTISTVEELQNWISAQKLVKRRFVPGVRCDGNQFSLMGHPLREHMYCITLKKGQTQICVTLVETSKSDGENHKYLVPDLGNGLAIESCYEAGERAFSIECWNATGYDVRVQLQFDKIYPVDSVIEWAKLAKVVDSKLVLPPKKKSAFLWDRTRAKVRNRYILDDVVFDVSTVRSESREDGASESVEIEIGSQTFLDWARKLRKTGNRESLPHIDWDLLFDSAWHVSERIQEQNAFVKAQQNRCWHWSPRDECPDTNRTHLLSPSVEDVEKVFQFYRMAPVMGKEPADIRVIYNSSKADAFRRRMLDLDHRHGNDVFSATWSSENQPQLRGQLHEQLMIASREFKDRDFPNVHLMPVWHGTKKVAADSIVNAGFAALQSTDEGWFGKGLYFAREAKYSYEHYGNVLLLCWVGFFSAYPVIDGDRSKLQGKGVYKNYDAHYVPIGSNFNPVKSSQEQMFAELVVFESMQCLPVYRVELKSCSGPAKLLGSQSVFKSSQGLDLVAAAKFCYSTYLSKPYTLGTTKWDWSYKCINRPNHGLAHTLRTMAYVPFVIAAIKHPKFANDPMLKCVGLLQLGMLFYVAGRENEAGSREDLTAYKRFRKNSAAAFVSFIKLFNVPATGFESLVERSIVEGDFEMSAVHCVMRIAHDIDCLRCQPVFIYNQICAPFQQYIPLDEVSNLCSLVLKCTQATGDRIMGHTTLNQSYVDEHFLQCSSNVDVCIDVLNGVASSHKK